jgi:hypothetical protein
MPKFFRGDAAFAIPELYDLLEAEGYEYVIRLKANQVLERHKVEWHQGELFPRVGFIVTNLGGGSRSVVDFLCWRTTWARSRAKLKWGMTA